MREVGVDLAQRRPHRLSREDAEWADVVVTMGCGDECPYIPGKRYIDWDLPDPRGQSVEAVRALRDDIHGRVGALRGTAGRRVRVTGRSQRSRAAITRSRDLQAKIPGDKGTRTGEQR